MQDRVDPDARQRALDIARQDPPIGISYQAAPVAIAEVLDSIGDTCPNASRLTRYQYGVFEALYSSQHGHWLPKTRPGSAMDYTNREPDPLHDPEAAGRPKAR
jgi:hypothetical protein